MNDRDIISMALCGFEATPDDDTTGSAEAIIGLTLEKAHNESEMLRVATESSDDTILAGALQGRIKALDWLITRHMDVKWHAPSEPAKPVRVVEEVSAEPSSAGGEVPNAVRADREAMEGDVEDLETVQRCILDAMLSWPSTEAELLPALRKVHAVSWSLRNWLESQAPKTQAAERSAGDG